MARGDLNVSQLGGQQRGNSISDRDVELIVMRVLTDKLGLSERHVQDLQALSGLRSEAGGAKPRAAVRRADLAVMGRIPELKSRDVAASVSADDFNALRLDVRRIAEALGQIARALK